MMKVSSLLIIIIIPSCNRDTCSKRLGFELDYYFFQGIYANGCTYCKLVNRSLKGDSSTTISLSNLQINEGDSSFQHGAVLIEVIDRVTEERHWDMIKNVKDKKIYTIRFALA